MTRASLTLIVAVTSLTAGAPALRAQGLNWEGQTGGIVTPTADVSASEGGRVGARVIAFHALDAGEVISTHFRLSVTMRRSESGRRVSIDAASVRVADEIAPGVDVEATTGFLAGASYSF